MTRAMGDTQNRPFRDSGVLKGPIKPAVFTLLVDAKTDHAAAFYQHHGFRTLVSLPRTLFLPVATAEKVLLKE